MSGHTEFKDYTVSWSMQVSAKTPVDAARQALKVQRDPHSTAVVFRVEKDDGYSALIDLEIYGAEGDETPQ